MPSVERDEIATEANHLRAKFRTQWEPHESLKQFLRDHYPIEAPKIEACRQDAYVAEIDLDDPDGRYRVRPKRTCKIQPWCIACMKSEHWIRLSEARDRIDYLTPPDPGLRAMHIVITAPVDNDYNGWGMQASKQITEFMQLGYDQLRWAYGDGIGCHISYQDFNETGPAGRHPHLDLTLSGYRYIDGKISRIPYYDVTGDGWDKWATKWRTLAGQVFQDGHNEHWMVNFKLQPMKTGWDEYFGALQYQLREELDPRKMEYLPDTQQILWWSYGPNGRPQSATTYTVVEFMARVAEYQFRLGQHQEGEHSKHMHRWFGHWADRGWRTRAKQIGGKPTRHRKGCTCNQCGNWERAYVPEAMNALLGRSLV